MQMNKSHPVTYLIIGNGETREIKGARESCRFLGINKGQFYKALSNGNEVNGYTIDSLGRQEE